jgi:hypothetical protein
MTQVTRPTRIRVSQPPVRMAAPAPKQEPVVSAREWVGMVVGGIVIAVIGWLAISLVILVGQ